MQGKEWEKVIYIIEWDTQIKKSCQTIKKNGYAASWKLIIAKCCGEKQQDITVRKLWLQLEILQLQRLKEMI